MLTLEELDKELKSRWDTIKKLQEEILTLKEQKDSLVKEKASKELRDIPEDMLITYYENTEAHYHRKCKFWEQDKYRKAFINRAGAYNPKTNQDCLRIAIPRDSTDEQLEASSKLLQEEIIPVLKPCQTRFCGIDMEADVKRIDIFEDSLSEEGCYDLYIDSKGYILTRRRYSIDSIIWKHTSLTAMLKYIRKNHPYG
mgnify:CR=1 FL=1